MKVYNQSLDFTLLALAACANGELEKAGKLLLKASKAPDVKRAVATLEASNAQAFAGEQAKIAAATKTKAAAKAAKPAAPKVEAAKRVAAKATQVKAFDMGDEAEIDGLIGDDEGFDEPEATEDQADEVVEGAEEEEGEDDFEATFASVMKGLGGKKR